MVDVKDETGGSPGSACTAIALIGAEAAGENEIVGLPAAAAAIAVAVYTATCP